MSRTTSSFWTTWGPPIGLCLTLFTVAYSVSLVPAIMPRIVRDLDSSVGYVQGALVLLALVKASFAPTCENLSQRYGRKQVFLGGLGLFSLGAIAAAFSTSIGYFVAAYSLALGIGSTPLLGSPRALMGRIYTDKAEKYALLALAVSSILGAVTGSVLGGWIASTWGWRWAFLPELILVPLIAWLVRPVSASRVQLDSPLDWVGGLFSFAGFGLVLLGISLAGDYGWWNPRRAFAIFDVIIPPFALSIVPVLISVGMICLGLFLAWRRQQIAQGKMPVMRLGLLRHQPFLLVLNVATLHTVVTSGLQFNLFQFVPAVFNINPFQTAIAIMPFQLGILVAIIASTFKLVDHISAKQIIYMGLALFSVGVLQLYQMIRPELTLVGLSVPLILMGLGSGLFLSQISILAFSTVQPSAKPEASGIYSPFQNLGSALGRGILGTVLITTASINIVDKAIASLGISASLAERSGAIATLQRVLQTYNRPERREFFSNLPEALQPNLRQIIDSSAIEAMQIAVLLGLAVSLLCLVMALWIPQRPLQP
jgi:MFS family permease